MTFSVWAHNDKDGIWDSWGALCSIVGPWGSTGDICMEALEVPDISITVLVYYWAGEIICNLIEYSWKIGLVPRPPGGLKYDRHQKWCQIITLRIKLSRWSVSLFTIPFLKLPQNGLKLPKKLPFLCTIRRLKNFSHMSLQYCQKLGHNLKMYESDLQLVNIWKYIVTKLKNFIFIKLKIQM